MLRKYAFAFAQLASEMRMLEGKIFTTELIARNSTLSLAATEKSEQTILLAKACCQLLGLTNVEPQIERTLRLLDQSPLASVFQNEIKNLYRRIEDELRDKKFLYVPGWAVEYYETPNFFGEAVADRFPEASDDIEHAAKCLALNEGTACVLHLIRVLDVALNILGKKLKVSFGPRDTWGTILNRINDEIQKMPQSTNRQKSKRDSWSEARVHLYHIKQAWRDNSMHAKRSYSPEQAKEIFQAVKTFMAHLAAL